MYSYECQVPVSTYDWCQLFVSFYEHLVSVNTNDRCWLPVSCYAHLMPVITFVFDGGRLWVITCIRCLRVRLWLIIIFRCLWAHMIWCGICLALCCSDSLDAGKEQVEVWLYIPLLLYCFWFIYVYMIICNILEIVPSHPRLYVWPAFCLCSSSLTTLGCSPRAVVSQVWQWDVVGRIAGLWS